MNDPVTGLAITAIACLIWPPLLVGYMGLAFSVGLISAIQKGIEEERAAAQERWAERIQRQKLEAEEERKEPMK